MRLFFSLFFFRVCQGLIEINDHRITAEVEINSLMNLGYSFSLTSHYELISRKSKITKSTNSFFSFSRLSGSSNFNEENLCTGNDVMNSCLLQTNESNTDVRLIDFHSEP